MQTYPDIVATDDLEVSRQPLLDRDDSNKSNFSGTGYPDAAITLVGQFCYRTDSEKLFQLKSKAPEVWKEVVDLSGSSAVVPLATALATARAIEISSDATGTANFDGSAAINIVLTLAASGVTAGTYSKVTVDSKGRVTVGANIASGDLPSTGDINARVGVRVDNAGSTYTRRRINFIQGAAVQVSIADDSGGEEVDVTLNVLAGTGITVAGDTVAIDTAVVPQLNAATAYTAVQKYTASALSIASNAVAWDLAAKPSATLSLTANVSSGMTSPTNVSDGAFYCLRVEQDGTGGRTIASWGSVYKWVGGSAPTISSAANAIDIFIFRGQSTTQIEEICRSQDIR